MILSKNLDKNNSKLIAEKYVEYINSGVDSSQILVLTFNSTSKKNIVKNILNFTQKKIISDLKIYTFNGLIYNSILDNWANLEQTINDNNNKILPNLSGLEVSQFIWKTILKSNEIKGYNSKKSLLHQLFRRYSLIVNNNLSLEEITKKSELLGEAFGEDAQKIIQKFKAKTLTLRAFDYIRQAQIFSYIYTKTNYFETIKYLLVEDADECTPLMLDFIKSIAPQLNNKLIILDKNGCSRCGYQCADLNAINILENIFDEQVITNDEDNQDITNLVNNILNNEQNHLSNFQQHSYSKRLEMFDNVILYIQKLISQGVNPNEISVISPIQDKMLKFSFENNSHFEPIFLSGNEKFTDNRFVKTILITLKLITDYKSVSEYDLRTVLTKQIGIPIKNCKQILEEYSRTGNLIQIDLDIYTERYNKYCEMINRLKSVNVPLSEKAYFIYQNYTGEIDKIDLAKFNFLLKELQDFEKVFDNTKELEKDIITQLENTIISENPYTTLEIENNNLVIATPQKIIDNKIKTKYQIWLDISSSEWIRSDIGPLYNSWVFQKNWDKEEYTIEDNLELTKQKTARTLRKLVLNTEEVIAYSSLFDTQGVENLGGIEKYIYTIQDEEAKPKETPFKIIPRDDQKPVLEYTQGKMAISAVPGAGKTTILLALIVKLMDLGINPENIYVMTYMESAARNFKDRIKSINPNNAKLPNISTIHGLALRILKENSNFERIGLGSDFEICDDTQRGRIIKSLSQTLDKQDLDDFDRAISVLKLSGTNLNPNNNPEIKQYLARISGNYDEMKLSRFLKFFYSYQELLAKHNLIDYDDILISAVKLLEENNDILEYYQNICEYMIEDEAQDSSSIQQRLINLLSAKHGNLIRCGDINQAITTTFTNADVDGFKTFIETSPRVDMNCSQRCAKGVWELANELVKFGNSKLQNAFYEIFMNPVKGRNPVEARPINPLIFKTQAEEKIAIVSTIKNILKNKPDATIGILLRNNYQVNTWANYINNNGLTAITRNECLGQKVIFKVIFSILQLISTPFDNETVARAYKALSEAGIVNLHLEKIIEDSEEDFITQDNDNITNADLAKFHWDINYWLSFANLSIDELVLKIGMNYFSGVIEKSNIYLISTLCSKLDNGDFKQTLQRLEELSIRPTLSGFKFFSEDEVENMTNGKIQIMTLHKSKGDEFDYVFLPEMTEKNLTLDIENLKLKKSSNFMENVRGLNNNYKQKTLAELKEFLIAENYRLLYVAITRAKQRLYLSFAENEKYFGKDKPTIPSIIFEELLNTTTT